jgi:hypothetical protein
MPLSYELGHLLTKTHWWIMKRNRSGDVLMHGRYRQLLRTGFGNRDQAYTRAPAVPRGLGSDVGCRRAFLLQKCC